MLSQIFTTALMANLLICLYCSVNSPLTNSYINCLKASVDKAFRKVTIL